MWIPFSTPSTAVSRPNRRLVAALAALMTATAVPAGAQHVVFDPRNHIENALQAARQLESLANEARSLAASPYSHLAGSHQSLQDMADLAQTVRGLSASVGGLEQQFESLYPDDLTGTAVLDLLEQSEARTANARRTAEDVARAAAELEAMGRGRQRRAAGALAASEGAEGQTAAVQSTNQLLAVLAEELTAMRTILLTQSRLMAEATARDAADRASGEETRRRRWANEGTTPAAPVFDPLSRARD